MLILVTEQEFMDINVFTVPKQLFTMLAVVPVEANTMDLKLDWLQETMFMSPTKICHGLNWQLTWYF